MPEAASPTLEYRHQMNPSAQQARPQVTAKAHREERQPFSFSNFSLPGKHMQKLLSGMLSVFRDKKWSYRSIKEGFSRQGRQSKALQVDAAA